MAHRLASLRAIGETSLANGLVALLREGERADPGLEPRLREVEAELALVRAENLLLHQEAARHGLGTRSGREEARRLASLLQDLQLHREDDVLHNQELTEQVLDQLPIPIFLKDRAGHYLRFNKRFEEVTQRTREEILGRTIEHIASPRWAEATRREDALAWQGQIVHSERRLMGFDPPRDVIVSRSVISSGGNEYMLGYFIDISEQRAARDAMQRAVESAETANRAKSEFLANMSHEIRTPMNGIIGMTELVLESSLTPEQRADLTLVKASAQALMTIVDGILDFSKVEAGKLDIEDVPFDLRQMVEDAVRVMALRARQKNLDLRCRLAPSLPRNVRGDPGRLRQVLINLIGNAIKFTASGYVEVVLALEHDDDEQCSIRFSVRDTGIGIPEEKQQLIFEPFAQVDGSTTRQFGGTGLGLTICRRLVILMQGELHVSSAPGQGSQFSFVVPLRHTGLAAVAPPIRYGADDDDADAAMEVAVDVAVDIAVEVAIAVATDLANDVTADLAADAAAGVATDLAADAPALPGSLRVLLAEDNPVNQRLALRLLEKLGHRPVLVDSGVAALELATHHDFDAVLMDVQMPGLDGLAATRHIRQWEHGGKRHVPIIAMTARAMAGDRERCLEAGMDDYLSKPVDLARLRQALAPYVAQAATPVLDWNAALLRLDGDEELLHELAALFLQDGPQLWDEVVAARAAGDQERSARAVHSLKGVLVNFGAQRAMTAAECWSAGSGADDALALALNEVYRELAARGAARL
ncbi:MAG: response regulator [Burkholderiaceae bacterium]|nr:response regulator [Burkholderiaceae bacterium]